MDKHKNGGSGRVRRKTKAQSNEVNEESGKPQTGDDTVRDIAMENVRERMERLRDDVVNQVSHKLDGMVSDVMEDLHAINKNEGTEHLHDPEILYIDKRKTEKNSALLEKEFVQRNSVLTDLYKIEHIKTIHHIFMVILMVLTLNTVTHDVLNTGSTSFGLNIMMRGFGKFSVVVQIWLAMFVSTIGLYYAANTWAHHRVKMSPNSITRKAWDFIAISLFITYQLALISLPPKAIVWTKLPPVSSLVVLTEQLRMVMKIHAFVRSTTPVVLSYKSHSDKIFAYPQVSKFIYFMFAPTLIYRDSYPRTKDIRWRFAMWHLTEVVLGAFMMSFLFERTLLPPFENFGKEPFNFASFVTTICATSIPSLLIFVTGFYMLLHAWMNAAAEVMQFGDRLFYKDWWNSTNFAMYYRRWNVVVHDWLYTYIYKDMYVIVTPGNRWLSTTAVFFVSAIFHEFILSFAFGFFFPVMLLVFGGVGFPLVFIRRSTNPLGNIFMWISLCLGSGFLISFYSMEYFARINCPIKNDTILDLLLPRILSCF